MVYLDYNATTPVDERVLVKMLPYFTDKYGNPSSRDHAFGWDAEDAVEEARAEVAELISAYPSEIVFTAGATESLNAAILGIVIRPGCCHAVVPSIEHEAVLEACRLRSVLTPTLQIEVIPVDSNGRVSQERICSRNEADALAFSTAMMANNEIGTIQSIRPLADAAQALGAIFLSDLAQAAGKIPIDVHELRIDIGALSAHKLYGPKGVGALFIRDGNPLNRWQPTMVGGGQERGRRGGTLNVAGIVGFGEACRLARLEMHRETARIASLRDRLEAALLSEIDGVRINGDRQCRLGNTSSVRFAGVDARALIRDMHDVAASTRAACSSGKAGPSHVLKAIGLSDEDAYSCIRFSLGRFTTEEEIDYTIQKVITSVHKLRSFKSVRS